MTYYAYVHCKPDGTPFYVGKGYVRRVYNLKDRNEYHKRVVAKYGADNILIGKFECSTNDISLELEVGLIKCLKRMGTQLTNLTEGGEGNVGWKCPDVVKQAVAEANHVRVWSDNSRQKIGARSKGTKRPEHAELMRSRKHYVGENNPWYGTGARQIGAKNHMARPIIGTHKDFGSKEWDTLKDTSIDIGVSIQAVCQAIKRSHRSKGWILRYK